jgi:hypothetical protein
VSRGGDVAAPAGSYLVELRSLPPPRLDEGVPPLEVRWEDEDFLVDGLLVLPAAGCCSSTPQSMRVKRRRVAGIDYFAFC